MRGLLVALLVLVSLLVTTPILATDVAITATPPSVVPTVTSSGATGVGDTSAILHGNITDLGGEDVTLRGFEWGLSTGNYTFNWTESGNFSIGVFEYQVLNLTSNTTYYWRALAVSSIGQGNSSERSFTTSIPLPLPPGNFTAVQLDINTVVLSWTAGVGADSVTIRISSVQYPSNVTEGYYVYNGNGTSCNITGLTLGELDTYYFSAWSENGAGYSLTYSTAKIGGEGTVLFIGLIILTLGLTALSFWRRSIVLSVGATIGWAAMGILMITSPGLIPGLDPSEGWTQVMVYLPFVMAVGCLLYYISGIGKVKLTQTDPKSGKSWSAYGRPPTETKPSRSQQVKSSYRDRIRGIVEKRR